MYVGERQDMRCTAHACSYVPSLAQIKRSASGGNRKQQQSYLEKQRYDQKMSRIVDFQNRFNY
ncbi:unnamed protein product [Thlaspi arvense]|uniref:Uncharacterized protein n=1 Tax=Thlaspi arvense TaxID=13288 RepID=A0AAU9R7N8_THLAR|nr:unnamed protein product [Thlaspi arvense]